MGELLRNSAIFEVPSYFLGTVDDGTSRSLCITYQASRVLLPGTLQLAETSGVDVINILHEDKNYHHLAYVDILLFIWLVQCTITRLDLR